MVSRLTGQVVPTARLDPAASDFEPLYLRIARHLAERIRSGALEPGARLPSEHELEREHGTSRATAIAALDELVRAHLAHRVRGRGTFVAKPAISRFSLSVGFSEDMRRRGLVPSSRDVRLDIAQPDGEIVERLDPPAEPCWRLVRLRLADGEPVALQETFLPRDLFPALDRHDLHGSLFDLMRAGYGLAPKWAEAIVEARKPDGAERRALGVTAGQPILLVWHLSLDDKLRPVEFVRSVYRSDRFTFASGRQPVGAP